MTASIEYAVRVLDVPLVVVLGHDSCGAVRAAHEAVTGAAQPAPGMRAIVERIRPSVELYSGDLAQLVNGRLPPAFRSIWFVGGGVVSAECLRLGLADEVRYSIVPIVIGEGIAFFEKLDKDVPLHLTEVKAYRNGMVELSYEVKRGR